jgi:hypothetical protein
MAVVDITIQPIIRLPQPAYDPPRAYYAPPPPVLYGAYDERHVWRDRNWWVSNRRQWVQEHHPEWLHNRG